MRAALLETKLYVPRPRRALVPRPRLNERLQRGSASRLTLVSAPAGFGKTTLVAQWLAEGPAAPADPRCAAWLSLDRGDNDPASFWTYLIAALRTAAPGVGAGALALLQAARPPSIDVVLTTLLNDLGGVPTDVVLVLDDYHVIENREVHHGMALLLEHLPPQVHLVIAGRADPALPLSRLRARGELVEVRAADLRFTPEEAVEYLTGVMGLVLTTPDVATLESRTEGWIAALQLAALSMQGREDVAGFIDGFAGDDRYIVDYLVEEVLQRQPAQVRAFLLHTSVLDRLTGPLCDAVTGAAGGRAVLEMLDRSNLFLVPLDDRRRWYRYHHLFADVLRARLLDEHPDQVGVLHRRAGEWFEDNGERPEAIRHSFASGDVERAADLVELAIPATQQSRQEATLRRWFEDLPAEVVRTRPVLSSGAAGSILVGGGTAGVERLLQDAERWLDPTTGIGAQPGSRAEMVVVDQDAARRLPAAIAVHRAGMARILGDAAGTMTHARRALELVGESDHVHRGAASALLGLAHWTSGDLEAAHRRYAAATATFEEIGHISDVMGCAIVLADVRLTQGRLREAMSTYERALHVAARQGAPAPRGLADMHVGLSHVYLERNDLDAAEQHLLTSRDLGEHAGLPQNRYRWRVAMAGIRVAEGDLDRALDLLGEAERLYDSDFSPDVRPVPAMRARVRIARGEWREVLGWAREQGLPPEDDVTYLREFEHVTLARALLAQSAAEPSAGALPRAAGLLDRLLAGAEAGGRAGSVIEILVLRARAHQLARDMVSACASMERALGLAEPEGYVRTFVDEGPPMAALLKAVAELRISPGYVGRLRTALGAPAPATPRQRGLVEALSEREVDVLRLLATDLGGPAIARELMVSLNTVRSHTKRIYTKLAVTNRRAAVRRAAELDLLARTRRP